MDGSSALLVNSQPEVLQEKRPALPYFHGANTRAMDSFRLESSRVLTSAWSRDLLYRFITAVRSQIVNLEPGDSDSSLSPTKFQ